MCVFAVWCARKAPSRVQWYLKTAPSRVQCAFFAFFCCRPHTRTQVREKQKKPPFTRLKVEAFHCKNGDSARGVVATCIDQGCRGLLYRRAINLFYDVVLPFTSFAGCIYFRQALHFYLAVYLTTLNYKRLWCQRTKNQYISAWYFSTLELKKKKPQIGGQTKEWDIC